MTHGPTIAWRGKVARAMDQVQQHRQPGQEVSGRIPCPHCGSPLRFTVLASGQSRGRCAAAGCISWL